MVKNASKLKTIVNALALIEVTDVGIDMGILRERKKERLYGSLWIFRGRKKVIRCNIDSIGDLQLSIKLMETFVKGKEF